MKNVENCELWYCKNCFKEKGIMQSAIEDENNNWFCSVECRDKKIEWDGDLNDDCTSHYRGFTLRAEMMDTNCWWWAVTKDSNPDIDFGASWDDAKKPASGKEARKLAEQCLKKHLEIK